MNRKWITILLIFALVCLPVMGTVVTTIYSSGLNVQVTCTLASLGSAAARQCAMVNNNTNNDVENHLYVVFKTGAAGVTSTGTVVVYFAPCAGASTSNCAGAGEVTGTDSAITIPTTPAYPLAAGFAASCPAYLNATTYRCGFSVASTFLGHQPSGYVPIILNNSGAAFDATCTGCGVFIDRIRLQNL